MKQIEKNELIEGRIYSCKSSWCDSTELFIWKCNKNRKLSYSYRLWSKDKNSGLFGKNSLHSWDNIFESTPEEKHWLEVCIKADKFVSYEEAMKTFVPEYVECIEEAPYNCYGKIGTIYKVSIWNFSPTDCMLEGTRSGSTARRRFKPSTKEAYDAQFKEPEFVLPEKWCIKLTNENQETVINYINQNSLNGDRIGIIGVYYGYNGRHCSSIFGLTNTEITFDQFKQYVLKENTTVTEKPKVVLEEPKDTVLQLNQIRGKGTTIVQVQCSEGGVYKIGDKITVFDKTSPNKGKPFTIQGFRWNNAKTKLCAVTELHTPNGIGLDKIELYIKPKVKIAHNFKIGDKISIIKKPVEFSQPHYLDKIFVVEKIENNRLIINNETNDLHVSDKSVLAKNVKLIEAKQELSLLEQAKLKYPVGTKFKNAYGDRFDHNYVFTIQNQNFTSYMSGITDGNNQWLNFKGKWAEIVDDFVLPENWHVKVTDDNKEILQQYIRNIHNSKKITLSNINYVAYSKWLNGVNQTENKLGYGLISKLNLNPLPNVYRFVTYYNGVEITFEQFKKYVLKDE